MEIKSEQQLVDWDPYPDISGKTPSFGDIAIRSTNSQTLIVTLPYEEGELRVEFKDVRAFLTTWDGDPDPFLTFEETALRPSDLFKVQASRWLSSDNFYLDSESSLQSSGKPWQHYCILSGERALHVAARDLIVALWVPE